MADPKQDPYAAYGGSVASGNESDPYAAYNDSANTQVMGNNPARPPQLTEIAQEGVKNLGVGIAKGAGNTVAGVGDLIQKIPYIGSKIIPESGQNAFHAMNTPEGAAQKTGYYGEQIGEMLLPTGLESKAAAYASKIPKAGKFVAPIARIGEQALETGIRNKLQGGDFTTGAAAGGIGSGVGMGLQNVAPSIAESALGVTKRDRGYGKTIGEAALNEISGIRPATIAKNAGEKVRQLGSEINAMAASHPSTVTLKPAIDAIDSQIAKATLENNATAIQHLNSVKDAITKEVGTGAAIPADVSAERALNLKRGLRKQFVNNWNPDLHPEVTRDMAQKSSGLIDKSLDQGIGPQFAQINQRESSLIPVAKKAESIDRGASTVQRIAHRATAHTGALAGSLAGAGLGYQRGGSEGALVGGIAGLAVPEIVASPTGQMFAARIANSPVTPAIGKGIALQLDRPSDEAERKKRQGKE